MTVADLLVILDNMPLSAEVQIYSEYDDMYQNEVATKAEVNIEGTIVTIKGKE